MQQKSAEFYDRWAERQMGRSRRAEILRWKARMLLRLCGRAGLRLGGTVVEIGCAEGALLAQFRRRFPRARYVGLDISRRFVRRGRSLHPDIDFRCTSHDDFFAEHQMVDFVVISDLLEHVADDREFLAEVVPHCRHALLKIPIEECVYDSSPLVARLRRLVGNDSFPGAYGAGHPDGHLRGYTVGSARSLLRASGLRTRAEAVRTVHECYERSRLLDAAAFLSPRLCVWLFGGAYFGVASAER